MVIVCVAMQHAFVCCVWVQFMCYSKTVVKMYELCVADTVPKLASCLRLKFLRE